MSETKEEPAEQRRRRRLAHAADYAVMKAAEAAKIRHFVLRWSTWFLVLVTACVYWALFTQ